MIRLARPIFVLLALGLLMLVGTTRAQEAAKDKKPLTPSQALLENWNDIGGRLVTMAEDWPEDKYTYKLAPTMRSFHEVILHVAGSNYDMINRMTKSKKGDARNDP